MVQHDSDQPGEGRGDEQDTGSPTRTVRLTAGEYLLTVNPVDGSEIEPCPPGVRPGRPVKSAPGGRPAPGRAGASFSGAAAVSSVRPLLEREEERERIARLLTRGRSVRLTAPAGAGRSVLLDAVAEDVAELAPDGVVRLSGYRRTPSDLLQEIFRTVFDAPARRPGRAELREVLHSVGAVVVLDDIEFGGSGLDELLETTPECAYLIAATPDIAAPSSASHLEEIFLSGLTRTGCLELLEQAARRGLTDQEVDWAADLWFETEGLPQSFVQAAALLRQREERLIDLPPAVGAQARSAAGGTVTLLAAGLTEPAREALHFAAALGGELPHHAHLPALIDDAHADDALAELTAAGLVSATGSQFRLAAGVAVQLASEGFEDGEGTRVRAAARHYTWWAGHVSVTPAKVAAEADAVLAAVQGVQRNGSPSAAVLLARTAAPSLAAGLRWGAWERVLRSGQEAARQAGEVAEEAYFHHELGVLALCTDNVARARAELEASIALRGVLADRGGAVAGRRALALVADRSQAAAAAGKAVAALEPGSGAGVTPAASAAAGDDSGEAATGPLPAVTGPSAQPPSQPSAGSPVSSRPAVPPSGGTTPPGVPAALGPGASAPGPSSQTPPPSSAQPPVLMNKGPAAPPPDPEHTAASAAATAAEFDSVDALISRSHGEEDGSANGANDRTGISRILVRGTPRNVVAAAAGAVLAVVLGTVMTLGNASDSGDGTADTVQPDPTTSYEDDTPYPVDGDGPSESADGSSSPAESSEPPSSAPPSLLPSTSEAPRLPSPSDDESDDGSSGGSSSTGGGGGNGGNGGSDNGGSDNGGSGDSDGGSGDPSDDPSESPSPSPSETTGSPDGGTTEGGDSPSATISGPAPSTTADSSTPSGGSSPATTTAPA